MKTVLNLLIEELEDRKESSDNFRDMVILNGVLATIKARYLDLEKEHIKKAYVQGNEDGFHSLESQSDYEIEGRDDYFSKKYFKEMYIDSNQAII